MAGGKASRAPINALSGNAGARLRPEDRLLLTSRCGAIARGDKKGAASRLKYLRTCSAGPSRAIPISNPARDVKPKKYVMEGFYSWAADEVKQFEEHHKIGTKRGSRANSDAGDKQRK